MSQPIVSPTSAPSPTTTPSGPGPVIVAVGGADAPSVVRAAKLLAPNAPDGILAVSVLEPLPVYTVYTEPIMPPPGLYEERRNLAVDTLTREVSNIVGSGAQWRTTVVDGAPAEAVTELARSLHSPLIVMGIGRHRPLDRIVGAETAVRAIGRAPCPVLAVHPDLVALFHDVVVAVDFSVASAHAAEVVLPLLPADATVHLLHLWMPAAGDDPRLAPSDEAYARSLPERFQRLVAHLSPPPGVRVKTVIRRGKGAAPILDYAETHHADLIVAGRHGLNAFRRLLVGSVTTALLRGANRSVLVSPEPPFAEADRLRRLLTGASESTNPAEWEEQLADFGRRNRGRTVMLEIDDRAYGAQVSESGYQLLGAAYDPRQRHVELTLGDAERDTRRVTRRMAGVDTVVIETDPTGRDVSLRISHGDGATALRFAGP